MSAKPRNPIVLIPCRMASTRLPGKPLAEIHGEPMIVHVWRRGTEAAVGPVVVACAEAAVAEAIERAGGRAVMTDPALPSGSDRIAAALAGLDPERKHDAVVCLQGDLPTIEPVMIPRALEPLEEAAVDIGTLATEISDADEREAPSVVKIAVAFPPGRRVARALYFSRAVIPTGAGPYYHHIGLYTYRRQALERFVSLPPGVLERRESLEQLRALEAGMRIDVALVDTLPLGVDTPGDLARAREILARPQ
ncbi:MAG TPA: 3-deoxy-manno-octulosonate cytidylyltransferase [Stellaceae bacterium]|nr:3-deoxy-manno-octulosonate cytidylyltransferase [Stellaceae bacterium]